MANSNRDALGRWASAQVSSGTDPAQRGAASSFAALPSASRSGASGTPPSISSATDPAAAQRQSGGSGASMPKAGDYWGNLHDATAKLLGTGGGASKGGGLKLSGGGGLNIQARPEMDLTPMGFGGKGGPAQYEGGGDSGPRPGPDNPGNPSDLDPDGPGPGSPPAPGFGAALRAGGFGGNEGPGFHQVSAFGGRAGHGADVPGTGLDFGGIGGGDSGFGGVE